MAHAYVVSLIGHSSSILIEDYIKMKGKLDQERTESLALTHL